MDIPAGGREIGLKDGYSYGYIMGSGICELEMGPYSGNMGLKLGIVFS